MKRILIGLSLMAAACSGSSPTSPSGSSTVQSLPNASAPTAADSEVVNPVDPTPPAPGANAPTPQYALTGPRDPQNCFTAGTSLMQWMLNVTDAGPRALRFVAVAHHDDQPGCEATTKNPRSRLEISGVINYTPHSSGQTTLTFNPVMYTCGRVQIDVSIFDAAGNEILIIGIVINYGSVCAPVTPPGLVCTPATQNASSGVPVTFTASGGSGGYTWSMPGGSPATGSGASVSSTYSTSATYVATVSAGGATATCTVNIVSVVVFSPLVCAPSAQTVGIGAPATMVAAGGSGSYTWSAPGGSTASGSGTAFSTSYPGVSTNTVTVSSGGSTATCQVTVVTEPPPPPALVCAPPAQTVGTGVIATMTATGGTGAYIWSAPGGATAVGIGATFSTSYPGAGANTVTVTSGAQTATCAVTVTATPPPPLVCAPPAQTVGIGVVASMAATGGTGAYTWSAPGGSTASGSGASFGTAYPAAGGYTVTVTSGALTATCLVTVTGGPPPPAPICAPAPTNPAPTPGVPFAFNITNAVPGITYSWAVAPVGATPASGTGTTFITSFAGGAAAITYAVTPSIPGAPGTACMITIPPLSADCPAPAFSTIYPFNNNGAVPLDGSATITGGGTWTFTLWAGYARPDDSDFFGYHGQDIKEQITVQCVAAPGAIPPYTYRVLPIDQAPPEASHGENWHGTVPPNATGVALIAGSAKMTFTHHWSLHPANYWWIELYHKPTIGPGGFVVGPPNGPGNWLNCKDAGLVGGVCRPPH